MASRKDAQRARMRRLSLNELDETLSLNKKPRTRGERKQAQKRGGSGKGGGTISDAEMKSIEKQIRQDLADLPVFKETGRVSTGQINKIVKESDLKIKPKVTKKEGKPGLIFGKGAKFRPFGGVIARALLGEDEKFGGDRGAIDFVRPKKKPQKKSNGGEMKKKGYAMGGAAMKSKMASKGGAKKFPDLTGDGKVTQADILKGRGVKKKPPGMMGGGMMKSKMASKGGKMGGKIPPGMKKGGAVRKKARGVGAAKRGFGKAMR